MAARRLCMMWLILATYPSTRYLLKRAYPTNLLTLTLMHYVAVVFKPFSLFFRVDLSVHPEASVDRSGVVRRHSRSLYGGPWRFHISTTPKYVCLTNANSLWFSVTVVCLWSEYLINNLFLDGSHQHYTRTRTRWRFLIITLTPKSSRVYPYSPMLLTFHQMLTSTPDSYAQANLRTPLWSDNPYRVWTTLFGHENRRV